MCDLVININFGDILKSSPCYSTLNDRWEHWVGQKKIDKDRTFSKGVKYTSSKYQTARGIGQAKIIRTRSYF